MDTLPLLDIITRTLVAHLVEVAGRDAPTVLRRLADELELERDAPEPAALS